MRRMICTIAVSIIFSISGICQQKEEMRRITAFSGVETEEELSEEEVERFVYMMRHPLKINLLSRSRLLTSGLFTGYQVASMLDYIKRNGEILSFAELSSLDGFSRQYVDLLRPFISLDRSSEPLSRTSLSKMIYNELSIRGGYRYSSDDHQWQYGLKYGIDVGRRFEASLGLSRGISEKSPAPSALTLSASYEFRRMDARLVVGDFNARFGQGLIMWNGGFMNSLTSPSGFMKRPSGLSSTRSFTGSVANTGVGSEFAIGQFIVSAAVAFPGLKSALLRPGKYDLSTIYVHPILNARWCGRSGTVGFTNIAQWACDPSLKPSAAMSSLDAAFCIKGVNLFSEIACDWKEKKVSFIAGTDCSPMESLRLASLVSWSQGEQWKVALSGSLMLGKKRKHSLVFSSEVIPYLIPKDKSETLSTQVKSQVSWTWSILDHLNLRIRISDRFRTWGQPHRSEIRTELEAPLGQFGINARMSLLKCRTLALLGHFDAFYKPSGISCHLRLGLFRIDHWDDRIYVYEYDAPGTFNVPAYSGRGVWTAAVCSIAVRRFLKLYFRTSYIAYPFMSAEDKKPGRAELKIQTVFRF